MIIALVLFAGLWALLFLFLDQVHRHREEGHLAKDTAVLTTVYRASIDRYQGAMKLLMEEIVQQEEVLMTFASGVNGAGKAQQEARDKLYRMLLPRYQSLTRQGIDLVHFHTRDVRSFLRFHAPDKYGDSLRDVRPSLVRANTEKRVVTGFEMGRIKSGFRNVFPILYQGEHLGSVEFSIPFDQIRDSMASLDKSRNYQLVLSRDLVFGRLWEKWREQYPPSVVNPDFVLDRSLAESKTVFVPPDNIQEINVRLSQTATVMARMARGESFSLPVRSSVGDWSVAFVPVVDTLDQHVGYFISYGQDPFLPTLRHDFYLQLGVGTVLLFGLFAIVYLLHGARSTERQEKHQLQVITDTIGDGLYVMDANGVVIQVNHTFTELLGYEANEIIGRVGHDIFHLHNESGQRIPIGQCPIYTRVVTGENYFGEDLFLHKDGRCIRVEVASRPMTRNGLRGSVSAFRDITVRKHNEHELDRYRKELESLVEERTRDLQHERDVSEKTNQLLKEAVSSIALGFTIYDEHDRLVICNEAYKSIYAASADLLVPGRSFEEIVRRGAERGQYKEAIGRIDEWVAERVELHQQANGQVLEQRLGDGRWLMIVEYRTPSGFIVGNRIDITPLKQAEAAIQDSNAQLDAIFKLSPDGLVSCDRSGMVKYANPAFFDMTDLIAADVIGRPLDELERCLRERAETPGKWPGLAPCFEKVGAGKTAAKRHLLTLRKPRAVVLDLQGANSDAISVGRLLYVKDVTYEVEVDRMKSEFLSHAAHELRTPMASIFGFSELLMNQEFDDETRRELIATIYKQTSWLIEIINELLDLSRIESGQGKDFKIESIDVVPIVREVIDVLQIDTARWPLDIDLPPDLLPARVDLAKLRQMLTNIIGNATKYSPAGGAIKVSARTRSDAQGGTLVGITVADHGIGMTQEQVSHMCERFYRADTSGNIPGSGLGMAIVKEVIELLGGRVEIASTPGIGTTVTLWLPTGAALGRAPTTLPA